MAKYRNTESDDDASSASTHLSWKIIDDEKSISNRSKLSDESEVKIVEQKVQKFRWIEVQRNDHITLKKRLLIKWSERREVAVPFNNSFIETGSSKSILKEHSQTKRKIKPFKQVTYNAYFKSLSQTIENMNEKAKGIKLFKGDSQEDKILIINDSKKHSGYKLTYLNKPAVEMLPRVEPHELHDR